MRDMDKMKLIEELAEQWAKDNKPIIVLSNSAQTPENEVKKAFIGGFTTALELNKDAWDAGYEAGKAYGMGLVKVKEDA